MKKSPACAGLEELVIVIPIRPVAGEFRGNIYSDAQYGFPAHT